MPSLLSSISSLQRTPVAREIRQKMLVFSSFQYRKSQDLFNELCFCLLTANFNAKKSLEIQGKAGTLFLTGTEKQISKFLKAMGHRFPNTRAHFIYLAQVHKDTLRDELFSINGKLEKREWLVKNIKGLGFKESSHFLRNIGFFDYAIIDFHIIDILVGNKIIKRPKTLNKKNYLAIEKKLQVLGNKSKLTLGELDLYLWYLETGTIYK